MRYSRQREEILHIVGSTLSHPTADWVYRQVRKRIPTISLGTVYRNLNQLVESGDVSCYRDGQQLRYDGDIQKHHHFTCTHCGQIYNVDIPEERFSELLDGENRFSVTEFSLEMMGICERCLSNNHRGS